MILLTILSAAICIGALTAHAYVSRAVYGQRLHHVDRLYTSAPRQTK